MLLTYDVRLSDANVMKQTSFFREQICSTSTHPNICQTYRCLLILHLQFCNFHIYQQHLSAGSAIINVIHVFTKNWHAGNKGCERTGFEKGFQGERVLKNVMSFEPCRKKQSCNTSPTTPSHEWCNQRLQRSYRDPVVGANCISILLFITVTFSSTVHSVSTVFWVNMVNWSFELKAFTDLHQT